MVFVVCHPAKPSFPREQKILSVFIPKCAPNPEQCLAHWDYLILFEVMNKSMIPTPSFSLSNLNLCIYSTCSSTLCHGYFKPISSFRSSRSFPSSEHICKVTHVLRLAKSNENICSPLYTSLCAVYHFLLETVFLRLPRHYTDLSFLLPVWCAHRSCCRLSSFPTYGITHVCVLAHRFLLLEMLSQDIIHFHSFNPY